MMSASQIDASFEYWLTISFGVLVAVHVTKGAIRFPLKILLCALYVSASLIAVMLTLGDVAQIGAYASQLQTAFPGRAVSATSDVLRMTVYAIGTAAISVAIFRYEKWIQNKGDRGRASAA